MPIFTFNCINCGEFEFIEPSPSIFFNRTGIDLFNDDAIIQCVNCNLDSKKILTIPKFDFNLQGTGWYKTDYK